MAGKVTLKERIFIMAIMMGIGFSMAATGCMFISKLSIEFGGPPVPWPSEFVLFGVIIPGCMGFFGAEFVPFALGMAGVETEPKRS